MMLLVAYFQLFLLAEAQDTPTQVHCTLPSAPCQCPVHYVCGNQTSVPGIAKSYHSQDKCCPEDELQGVGTCRPSSKFDFTCCSMATRMCQYGKDVLCCNRTRSSACGMHLAASRPCCVGEEADCCAVTSTTGYDCSTGQACCYPESIGCKASKDMCVKSSSMGVGTVLTVVGAVIGSIGVCLLTTRGLYRCRQRRGVGHQALAGLRAEPAQVLSSSASPQPPSLVDLS